MGFLAPLFLIGVLAAAVPIVLHLFRQQAGPVVPFSAVRFVPRVPLHRARRKRLHDMLLLALRIAALVLLAISFARPYLGAARDTEDAGLTIVALDRSFSMSSPGRMDRARALALDVLEGLPGGTLAAVIAFDSRAVVLQGPTRDRAEAKGAVALVESGFGATRYDAALAAAAGLAARRTARLVVVSDLQRSGWPEGASHAVVPASLTIETRTVGAMPENLLVASLRRDGAGIAAEIRNTGIRERLTRAVLSIDGREAAQQQLTVPAGGAAEASFGARLPSRGAVSVAVDDEPGYVGDNVRYGVLDPATRRRVLAIVSPGGEAEALYLTKAIAAAEENGALDVEALAADAVASRPDALQGYEAVVILGSRGFDARAGAALGAALDRGCGLLLVAGPRLDWPWLAGQLPSNVRLRASVVETAATPLAIAPSDIRHPVFQESATDSGWVGTARFRRILRVAPDEHSRVLAHFTNGAPALVELAGGKARVLAFASDLGNEWNDFALQAAFVPFVHALIRYVAAARPPVREVHVGGRSGPEWTRPGVVADAGADGPRVAVNVDLRESAGASMSAEAFAASIAQRTPDRPELRARDARAREAEQSWWWYGLVLMLTGLVVESVASRARRAGAHA